MYIQQGDVILHFDSVPTDAILREDAILAEGEVTGHKHAIAEPARAQLLEKTVADLGKVTYVKVKGNTGVKHEEHHYMPLMIDENPTGEYRMGIVKEFDPFTKRLNQVKD